MRLSLIVNPSAGKGKALRLLDSAIKSLQDAGIEPEISRTKYAGHAHELAKEAMKSCDVIASLGGDGTLNEIARAIKHTGIPLAVMPAGTGNDFIKSYAPRATFDHMARAIANGKTRTMDMASVNEMEFINVFGIGFDAVVSAENARITSLGGLASYALALIKSLGKYRRYPVTLSIGKQVTSDNAAFVTIGNGPICGGGFRLTPDALPDDGLLDVTLIGDVPLHRLLPHIGKAFNGRISDFAYTRMMRTESIIVSSTIPLPAHLDGEVVKPYRDTYEIKIMPRALTVIAP